MPLSIPEIHTDLLWDLSVLFGSLSILYFGFIFFFRNRISSKARNIGERRRELTPMISNFLFYGEDASKEEKYEYIGLKVEIREFIKDPIDRSIVKDILLDLQRDLTGDARDRLFTLYKDFDLHLDAFAKLKSWRWEVVTKGIVELTQMEVKEAYSIIRKFINNRRSVIRRQAQIATVSLKEEGIAHFLDSNTYPISEWQQIKILEILRNKKDFIPPSFGLWLTSSNKDVVLFALRLIRYYNQTNANTSVTELLKHKDEEVKQAAIDCIREFGITQAIPTLIASFARAKRDSRILILDALGCIGSEAHIPFLREVHQKVSDFNVRSKALGAINAIAPESVLPIENLDPRIQPESTLDLEDENSEIQAEETAQTPEETSESAETEIAITEEGGEFFHEDLEVFDHCFMEELSEILDGLNRQEDEEEPGVLPLDFLPIIIEKPTSMDKKTNKKSRKRLRHLRVNYEEVHPDAEFREELESILSRVEVQDLQGNTEVEFLNFKFLPFVVENEPEGEIPELAQVEQSDTKEEEGPEIPINATEESSITSETAQETWAADEWESCALVDWEVLQNGKPLEEVKEQKEEISTQAEEPPHPRSDFSSHSIFEDLYRIGDEDSKHILLDQIPELGDHKELSFLLQLEEKQNTRLRKKIFLVTRQLRNRLESEEGEGSEKEPMVRWESQGEETELNFDLG